jgi:hypothetical protein
MLAQTCSRKKCAVFASASRKLERKYKKLKYFQHPMNFVIYHSQFLSKKIEKQTETSDGIKK